MKLEFDNKLSEKQILSNAAEVKADFTVDSGNSMLFKGDNFNVLSVLLKKI